MRKHDTNGGLSRVSCRLLDYKTKKTEGLNMSHVIGSVSDPGLDPDSVEPDQAEQNGSQKSKEMKKFQV